MSQQTTTPQIVLIKTKSGKGYTVYKKNSNIPSEHFKNLLDNEIMIGFPSKDKSTGEVRKTQSGKTVFVNFIANEKYGDLQQYCQNNDLPIEVLDAPPTS